MKGTTQTVHIHPRKLARSVAKHANGGKNIHGLDWRAAARQAAKISGKNAGKKGDSE